MYLLVWISCSKSELVSQYLGFGKESIDRLHFRDKTLYVLHRIGNNSNILFFKVKTENIVDGYRNKPTNHLVSRLYRTWNGWFRITAQRSKTLTYESWLRTRVMCLCFCLLETSLMKPNTLKALKYWLVYIPYKNHFKLYVCMCTWDQSY